MAELTGDGITTTTTMTIAKAASRSGASPSWAICSISDGPRRSVQIETGPAWDGACRSSPESGWPPRQAARVRLRQRCASAAINSAWRTITCA